MPSMPMARPLNTEVSAKPIPLTVPISPFALSWRSSGTSRVTVVDNATVRRFPAIAPASTIVMKAQKAGRPRSWRESPGVRAYSSVAAR